MITQQLKREQKEPVLTDSKAQEKKEQAPADAEQRETMCGRRRAPASLMCLSDGSLLRPKLKIGSPNDKYEQEADRVAEEIMRMPESIVERKEKLDLVRFKTDNSIITKHGIPDIIEEGVKSLNGKGQRLPHEKLDFYESRFGMEFDHVRVHVGSKANALAETTKSVEGKFSSFIIDKDDYDLIFSMRKELVKKYLELIQRRILRQSGPVTIPNWVPSYIQKQIMDRSLKRGVTVFPRALPYGDIIVWIASTGSYEVQIYQEFPKEYEFYLEASSGDDYIADILFKVYTDHNDYMRYFVIEKGMSPEYARSEILKINEELFKLTVEAYISLVTSGMSLESVRSASSKIESSRKRPIRTRRTATQHSEVVEKKKVSIPEEHGPQSRKKSVATRERRQIGGARGPKPLSRREQKFIDKLVEEHGISEKTAKAAVKGAKEVKGRGVEGADVLLRSGKKREVFAIHGKVTKQNIFSKLAKKPQLAESDELFIQINDHSINQSKIAEIIFQLRKEENIDLIGKLVKFFDREGNFLGRVKF
ncbi:MAG: hypothetical protein P8107_12025 [Spirochaetia bacterium]